MHFNTESGILESPLPQSYAGFRFHWRSLGGLLLVCLIVSGVVLYRRAPVLRARGTCTRARVANLVAERHKVRVERVFFPRRRRGALTSALRFEDVVVLASPPNKPETAPKEVFLLSVRLSAGGVPLEAKPLYNLSGTPRLDENHVAVDARGRSAAIVAFAVGTSRATRLVHVIDTRGEAAQATRKWPWYSRMAAHITNWQETGRPAGLDRQILELRRPLINPHLRFDENGCLHIGASAPQSPVHIVYDPDRRQVTQGRKAVDHQKPLRGRRPMFNWLVDTVRNISWIGPEKIAMLEVAVFGARDALKRAYYRVRYGHTAHLHQNRTAIPQKAAIDDSAKPYTPKTGILQPENWPPPPIKPLRTATDPREGRWMALDRRFIPRNPDAPEPVLETFVHPDPRRPYSVVGIFLWDPRQVELGFAAGTKEPNSTTGFRGKGKIPRDDRIKNLLAAFNGGFQTLHGDFGMQSDGRLIREPVRWAATVASERNGRLLLGTWEKDGDTVPARIRGFRQNLAPLLEDDKINPLGNRYWGWAIKKYREKVHIVRSGLCLTKEGFGAYFWGKAVSLKSLTRAMVMARCRYGMQMDINYTNASLELYRVLPRSALKKPLARRIRTGQGRTITARLPGRKNLAFRARSWLPGMYLAPFPRYIRNNWRDFAYLRLREILPGPKLQARLTPALPGEGEWKTLGLFQGHPVFPARLAVTFLRPLPRRPQARVELVKLDPRLLDFRLSRNRPSPAVDTKSHPPHAASPNATAAADTSVRSAADLPVARLCFGSHLPAGLRIGKQTLTPEAPTLPVVAVGPQEPHGPPRARVMRPGVVIHSRSNFVIQGKPLTQARLAPIAAAAGTRISALGADQHGFLCYAVTENTHANALVAAFRATGCRGVWLPPLKGRGPLLLGSRATGVHRLPGDGKTDHPPPVEVALVSAPHRHSGRLFRRGVRPREVHFSPTRGAYKLNQFYRSLLRRGIHPKSPRGRALKNAWLRKWRKRRARTHNKNAKKRSLSQ
jgi:hypothetical protein